MPFTPFHMGPGAAIKAVSGGYFSLTVFGFAQVIIDIEPLIRILQGDKVLHGFTHTYLGAAVIGLFSLFLGKKCCEWLLRLWNSIVRFNYFLWLRVNPNISWTSATLGAFIGTFSHVLLDSLIHSDMHPFAPFNTANGLLHLLPTEWVYLLCACLGIIGVLIMIVVSIWNKWAIEIE
jgi:membrane-bound metal-dependent hydrolase YbcI (DUF457 family)